MPKRSRDVKVKEGREDPCIEKPAVLPLKVRSGSIFILENASMKKGYFRKKQKMLNSEEDTDFVLRQGKSPNDYRPDIAFEALKGILDSRLNKYGMIGAVYVHTDSGLLFEVKPHVRIPRTCKRFCGIILELFEKSCIRAKDTGDVLMRVLDGPVTRHLPSNARVIGLSYNSKKLVDIEDYISDASDDFSPVFVVGAMVHGEITKEYTNDLISVSKYPLSARCCIGIICGAIEQKYKLH